MLVRLSYQCDICGRWGQDPALSGYCVCGFSAWTNYEPLAASRPPAPPPPAPLPPAPPPPAPSPATLPRASPPAAAPVPLPPSFALRALTSSTDVAPRAPRSTAPSRNDALLDDFVSGADAPDIIVDDFGPQSRLNELLGGIKRGALLLIAGAAGAGKSTAAAELAVAAVEHWSSPEAGELRQRWCHIFWLDSDQGDHSLIKLLFSTVGPQAEAIFASRVKLLDPQRTYTWESALARVPDNARIVVVDSLEHWGGTDKERLGVLTQLRGHPAWLKIVLAGANASGKVSGMGALERRDDATIYAKADGDGAVQVYRLRFTKRRWRPCASYLARCAPAAEDDEADDDEADDEADDDEADDEADDDEADDDPPEEAHRPIPARLTPAPRAAPVGASPPSAVPPVALAPGGSLLGPRLPAPDLPDFSPSFLTQAARWEPSQMTRYLAQCRARPVPRDTLAWWMRGVQEARQRLEVEARRADKPEPTDEDALY